MCYIRSNKKYCLIRRRKIFVGPAESFRIFDGIRDTSEILSAPRRIMLSASIASCKKVVCKCGKSVGQRQTDMKISFRFRVT